MPRRPRATRATRQLLALLSGPAGDRGPAVEWEGTRYRVSFSSAESFRLRHLLGESPLPYLTAADTLVRTAKTLEAGPPSRQALTAAAEAIAGAAEATHCADKDEWVTVALQRPLPGDGDGDRAGGEVRRHEERASAGAAAAPAVGRAARAWTPGAGLRGRPRTARQRRHLAARCGEPAQFRIRHARLRPRRRVAMAGVGRRPGPRLASHRLDARHRPRAVTAGARPHHQPPSFHSSLDQRRGSHRPQPNPSS